MTRSRAYFRSVAALAALLIVGSVVGCAPRAEPESLTGVQQEQMHPRHDTGLDSQVADH